MNTKGIVPEEEEDSCIALWGYALALAVQLAKLYGLVKPVYVGCLR